MFQNEKASFTSSHFTPRQPVVYLLLVLNSDCQEVALCNTGVELKPLKFFINRWMNNKINVTLY